MHGGYFDFAKRDREISALIARTHEEHFWDNPQEAKAIQQRLANLHKEKESWENMQKDVHDLLDLARLDANDTTVSLREDIEKRYSELKNGFESLEYTLLFSDVYDRYDAIVAIHAGTGGTDAQNWTEMLLRMYLRYAEQKGFVTNILSISHGAEAGIKKVVFEVLGLFSLGYMKSEAGVHRLVRISPFDAEKMRHTSFALVEVLPDLGDIEEIDVNEEDLKIEVFRSSGHGGQSVNTTDSAVRMTHIPTGIVVVCMNERSQYQNKRRAVRYLKSKLHAYYSAEQEEEKKKLRGEFSSIAWGNQIRSYVLHPYKMIKDHRTDFETNNVEGVLDGDIDAFVEAFLRKNASEYNQKK
jgi:peptide chain release factor 2